MEAESNRQKIINQYMDFVLTNENPPKSIYQFCKTIEIEESEFYKNFNSFEILEEEIYSEFHHITINLLKNDEAYQTLDNKNKLITYYYTIFEMFNANRSYVIWSLKMDKIDLKKLKTLKSLKQHFTKYINDLGIEKIDLKKEQLNKFQEKSFNEVMWLQFMSTLKFWIDDTSIGFEKTELLIEKSLTVGFNVIENNTLKDIIDLGKFFYKEKIKPQM